MDAFEIMSVARSYSGLTGQNNIGDLMLLRFVNMANKSISQLLLPVFQQYLIKTTVKADQIGTQVEVPGDSLRLINVEREFEKDTGNYKPASPVDVANKTIIVVNPDFIASEDFPLFVDEGRYVQVYPTMAEIDELDVRLQYRKRIADIVYGKVTDIKAITFDEVTLNTGASLIDDYYNDYFLALYAVSDGVHTLIGNHLITDYDGAGKVASINPATTLDNDDEVYYSLEPIIPVEFHNLIVDGTLIELAKAKKIPRNTNLEEALINRINSYLGVDFVMKAEE